MPEQTPDRPVTTSPAPVVFSARTWTAVICAAAVWTIAISWLLRWPCRALDWSGPLSQVGACYSDMPYLYSRVGMSAGQFPYLDPGALLEYPVLQSVIAVLTGLIAYALQPQGAVQAGQAIYFDLSAISLAVLWAVIVLLCMRMLPHRRLALVLAVSPAVAATGLINWDLWAAAAAVGALFAVRRQRWLAAGALMGLGTALKLWPLLLLGAVIVLGIRRRRLRPALLTGLALVVTWAAVNLPFYLWDPRQWSFFWSFSGGRAAGYSSIYHVWNQLVPQAALSASTINLIAYGAFGLACLGILLIGLIGRRAPDPVQLGLLIVAAFVLTNKVYSPQFVLWLTPLVLLARPRVRAFLAWQVIEVLHWLIVFSWLGAVMVRSPQEERWTALYAAVVLLHMLAVLVLCALTVRDVLAGRPPEQVAARPRDARPAHQEPTTTPEAPDRAGESVAWARERAHPAS